MRAYIFKEKNASEFGYCVRGHKIKTNKMVGRKIGKGGSDMSYQSEMMFVEKTRGKRKMKIVNSGC